MVVAEPGHKYILENLDGDGVNTLEFVNRGHEEDMEGTNNQEVLRVLIHRVKFLNTERPWSGNEQIINHLRSALLLHEMRHLERLMERNEIEPEHIKVGTNGHFLLTKT